MNITNDVFIGELLIILNHKDIINLSITCKEIYNIINKSKYYFIFNRGKRLTNFYETKNNYYCSIVLDKICYINSTVDNPMVIIFIKTFVRGLPIITIKYTNNEWKTTKESLFNYYKDDIHYQIFYKHEIEWFALKIDDSYNNKIFGYNGNKINWDNNNGWNYCISKKYHIIKIHTCKFGLNYIKHYNINKKITNLIKDIYLDNRF